MDKYTKFILTVIAINLTVLTVERAVTVLVPEVSAQSTVNVRVVGGRLDYETDVSGGPTLKVCTQC